MNQNKIDLVMCEFVNFSIAKKLKEKGFKEKCYAYYTPCDATLFYNTNNLRGGIIDDCLYSYNSLDEKIAISKSIDAPTISQVLKWLRKEKKIHVIIATFVDQLNRCYTWGYEIWNISEFPKHIQHVSVKTNFTDDDKAALAGIEYVLDNLIFCKFIFFI